MAKRKSPALTAKKELSIRRSERAKLMRAAGPKKRTRRTTRRKRSRSTAGSRTFKIAGMKVKGLDNWMSVLLLAAIPIITGTFTPEAVKTKITGMGLPLESIDAVVFLALSQAFGFPALAGAGVYAATRALVPFAATKWNLPVSISGGTSMFPRMHLSGRNMALESLNGNGNDILRMVSGPAGKILRQSRAVPDFATKTRLGNALRPFDRRIQAVAANPSIINTAQANLNRMLQKNSGMMGNIAQAIGAVSAGYKASGQAQPPVRQIMPAVVDMVTNAEGNAALKTLFSEINKIANTSPVALANIGGKNTGGTYPEM